MRRRGRDFSGSLGKLKQAPVLLVCFEKRPGKVSLKAYDFARRIHGSGIAIVSGFHPAGKRKCNIDYLTMPGKKSSYAASRVNS